MKTVFTEVIGTNELSASKWADGGSDLFSAAWAGVGIALDFVSNGWLGWGLDVAEARWLVQVKDLQTDDVRTVRTTFTRWGARRGARRIRKVLNSGDASAIAALPDYVYADQL